jgi:myo-inositol-1(or 4)-monophosphatase
MLKSQLLKNSKIAERAAERALSVASGFLINPCVLSDDFKDIKTKADLAMNEAIISELRQTNIAILSEETEFHSESLPEMCWVIDPLDGTYNFARKFPFSGISIALLENNTPIIGIVVDVFGRHTFSSGKGIGADKNGSKINVSKTDRIKNATLTTGFPSGTSYETDHLLNFVHSIQEFKKVRALGAASLMLSLVAEGIFDVYYEKDIYLWDVAAGLSLVKEAGGEYFLRKTNGSFQYEVLASNAIVFKEAMGLLINSQS